VAARQHSLSSSIARLHGDERTVAAPLNDAEARAMRRTRLFGATGTVLMGIGALGAGARPVVQDPTFGVRLLNLPSRIQTVSLTMTTTGAVMMALAWLMLGRFTLGPRRMSRSQLDHTLLLWMVPLLIAPPMYSKDVYSYLAQSQISRIGLNPYKVGPAPGLGLDHVDVLYLHCQSTREGVQHEALMKAMEQVKQAGKTRFLGVSTHKNEPEVLRAAVEAKLYDVVLTSYNFKQDHHLEVQKAIGEAATAGLGIVAMKTQAGVYWDKEKTKPIDPRAALRWALRDPNVATAIPGFTTFDQLQDDLAVLHEPAFMPADDEKLRDERLAGLFCQGCEKCLEPCPEHLPIPELMRSYMYSHAYRNREAAQSLLLALDLPASLCDDCDACPVVCAKGFDVRARIRDIVRLRDVPREFLI